MRWWPVLLVGLGLGGCVHERARLTFTGEGQAETRAALRPGPVDVWVDVDLEAEGARALLLELTATRQGQAVATARCDVLGRVPVRQAWQAHTLGGHVIRRGRGRLACALELPEGGPVEVSARLTFEPVPAQVRWGGLTVLLSQAP